MKKYDIIALLINLLSFIVQLSVILTGEYTELNVVFLLINTAAMCTYSFIIGKESIDIT
jgi:hypothetical protein